LPTEVAPSILVEKKMSEFQPLETKNRLSVADALRGIALFGILLANVPYLEDTTQIYQSRTTALATPGIDRVLTLALHLLIDKKFITIFSILFGFGFYIQMNRAEEKHIPFRSYFIRRMVLLLIIGCIHAYIFWFGDITRDYAICGMFLLLVYRWSFKKILITAIIFNVLFTGAVFIANAALGLGEYSYDRAIAGEMPVTDSYMRYLQINATIDPFVNFIHDSPLTLVFCFGNMLIGFWMAKAGFFHQTNRFSKAMSRLIMLGATIGIAGSYLFVMITSGQLELTPTLLWIPFLVVCCMILQSLFYISAFVKLFEREKWRSFLLLFAPVGKMALTNYLLQTLFYLLIFYHCTHGLSLYGKITITETFLIAAVLFALQIVFSSWWLKHHQQGPVEYIWKKLSYAPYRKVLESGPVLTASDS